MTKRGGRERRDDHRITVLAMLVVSIVALAASLATFGVLQTRLEESERERVVEASYRREIVFSYQLRQVTEHARLIAERPSLRRAVRAAQAGDSEHLAEEIAALLREGVGGVRIEDAQGRVIAAQGHVHDATALRVEFSDHPSAALVWDSVLVLTSKLPLTNEAESAFVRLEEELPLMTRQLADSYDFGKHGQVHLCAPASRVAMCFPTKEGAAVYALDTVGEAAVSAAMSEAFVGDTGSGKAFAANGSGLLIAHSPLLAPLGLVVAQDIGEAMAPVRRRLGIASVAVLLLMLGGVAVLHWRLRPLARRLVLSERQARESMRELAQEEERFRITLASIGEAVIATDSSGRVTYLNPVASTLLGCAEDRARGLSLTELLRVPQDHLQVLRAVVAAPEGSDLDMEVDLPGAGAACTRRTLAITSATIHGHDGAGSVLVFRDVTDERRRTAQISHNAAHDPLTGLANRAEFARRLQALLDDADIAQAHAVMFIDLDRFKPVNDTAGHAAGDELLRQIAHRLASCVRAADTVARVGGDEFAVLLPACEDSSSALAVAEALRRQVEDFVFCWEAYTFRLGASIGVTSFRSQEARSADSLLAAADACCYAAKRAGRNRVEAIYAGAQALS